MKNLKIAYKLIVGFSIISLLAVIVGGVGIVGISALRRANESMYQENVTAIDALGSIRENYAQQRAIYRNFIIYEPDSDYFQSALIQMTSLEENMEKYIAAYTAAISKQEDINTFNKFLSDYRDEFKNLKDHLIIFGMQSEREQATELLASPEMLKLSDSMAESMYACHKLNVDYAKITVDSNTAHARILIFIQIFVLAAAIILSILLTLYISKLVSKPLITMTKYMQKVSSSGDTGLGPDDVALIEQCSVQKDETSVCIASTAVFVTRVLEIGKTLEIISHGDLSMDFPLLSEHDTIGIALRNMIENLNAMFDEISSASSQVSLGSRQIADGSQSLAQGSTQQAAAVEELSSSISEISKKTDDNAKMAEQATALASTIKQNAEKGSRQMSQMLIAVQEIKEASQNISKVIKAIDDIAFQTNILALNAAVEAARAGQHGKGFAVVAEEVRNLAAKSAEAAKNTGSLITDSMDKAELGAHIAGETASSLSEIVTGINDSSRIIDDISTSSEEQALSITQINKGIDQVAQVIQQTSATSEEAAAAAEEMSEQSDMLESLIARFKLKNNHNYQKPQQPIKNQLQLADKYEANIADKY